jgi:lysophospholipase L1-like esterase
LQSFCAQRNYVYLNYYSTLLDAQGQLGTDLSDDGLHPNSKGYRLMAPLLLEAVDRAQGPPPAPAPVKPKKRKDASQ